MKKPSDRIPSTLRQTGQADRRKSVYDFLFDIENALDPMRMLTESLQKAERDRSDSGMPARLKYGSRAEAEIEQARLRGFLNDAAAGEIMPGQDHDGFYYALGVSHSTIQQLTLAMATLETQLAQIKQTFSDGDVPQAQTLRAAMVERLVERKLFGAPPKHFDAEALRESAERFSHTYTGVRVAHEQSTPTPFVHEITAQGVAALKPVELFVPRGSTIH